MSNLTNLQTWRLCCPRFWILRWGASEVRNSWCLRSLLRFFFWHFSGPNPHGYPHDKSFTIHDPRNPRYFVQLDSCEMPFEILPSDRQSESHAEKNGSNSTTGWQHHSVSCKGQAWCLSIASRADTNDKLHWLIHNSCNYPGAYVGRLHIIVFFASFMFASSLVPSQLSKSLVLPSALILRRQCILHPTPLKLQPPNIRAAFQSCELWRTALLCCFRLRAVWKLKNLR